MRRRLPPLPIVFLGPSLPVDEARRILAAEYHPPIKRGDLDGIDGPRTVAIIDGVFQQDLSVAPKEITSALARGLLIFGSSSMGALRAAEVPGMVGIGTTFQWFRDGVIERDDEVALVFDPDTYTPRSVPLVNIRHALTTLSRQGTLEPATAKKLLGLAKRAHFGDRAWPSLLRAAGIIDQPVHGSLLAMLSGLDLKRQDAVQLLEGLARGDLQPRSTATLAAETTREPPHETVNATGASAIVIWEDGDVVHLDRFVRFLKLTGAYASAARTAAAVAAMRGPPGPLDEATAALLPSVPDRFTEVRRTWGWYAAEEVQVTLLDLGMTRLDVQALLAAERRLRGAAAQVAPSDLRDALFIDELALKREALRCAAFDRLVAVARRERVEPTGQRDAARALLCRATGTIVWTRCVAALREIGIGDADRDAFLDELALVRALAEKPPKLYPRKKLPAAVRTSKKAPGSRRFARTMPAAWAAARGIAKRIGVTRVGVIGQLGDLPVHVGQAFRPGSPWSTTIGSGKSTTTLGAKIGSVLEEAEAFSQERFPPETTRVRTAREEELLRAGEALISPDDIDLPFDSRYAKTHPIEWVPIPDLASGKRFWAPLAAFTLASRVNDPYYSQRLGRKVFSTNGLASGFSLAEALVHALCEYLERHTMRLAELSLDNPGGLPWAPYQAIAHASLPPRLRRLVARFRERDLQVRLTDVTSAIGVPTFEARLFGNMLVGDSKVGLGSACHPDPEVAAEMALLEAAQGKAVQIAGAREDLTLQARSLGRHERPRPESPDVIWRRYGPAVATKPFAAVRGLVTRDHVKELDWTLDAVCRAGFGPVLWIELTAAEVAPARVVRVLVPGLETTCPLFTGLTARKLLVGDLLARGDDEVSAARRR